MTYKKKLIEVALPLEAINKESAREKSIRHGHPSTLHLWWSRKPLATCRAVLFASLVDDPSSRPEEFPTEEAQEVERQRLFRLIEQLVKWENSNDERILDAARKEIMKSTGGNPPPVYDPFCGGGSIPLEAQRLGLEAYGSDLNPVAVMITKALIEIPPKFAGKAPVNPEARKKIGRDLGWKGSSGLAEDTLFYGLWMQNEAKTRIGHLYPKVKLPVEQGGGEATVITWLWARTVKCPNPACGCEMILANKFWLSTKKGKEAWIQPIIDPANKRVQFEVKAGKGKPPEGTVNRRSGATCLCCGTAAPFEHVRSEGQAGRMDVRLMAIIAEGSHGRVYVGSNDLHEKIARSAVPVWKPDNELVGKAAVNVPLYGLKTYADLFTSRQLVALTTFSDLVGEVREKVMQDAQTTNFPADVHRLNDGGLGAAAYADAVATYLAFAVDKCSDYWNTIATWMPRGTVGHAFSRQAIPITWDFPEANPLVDFHCAWSEAINWVSKQIDQAPIALNNRSYCYQHDATQINNSRQVLFSTDPPYYDNIAYADLSDFFYVWMRRSIGSIFPDIFSTMLVPKASELVATPYRFGGNKVQAQKFFEAGLGQAFEVMRKQADAKFPLTVYYAFKQSEIEPAELGEDEDADATMTGKALTSSTGWETMLTGLLHAGFFITGTWPVRSERSGRMLSIGTNALASSIVLVCRPRPMDAPTVTRKEFLSALRRELPQALKELRQGNIAPVDLAQATVGPGMAVFSQYAAVLEANGQAMPIRTALQIINQELDSWLVQQEGAMDQETRFCVAWYDQFGLAEAAFGEADVLARAKNTAVQKLEGQGLLSACKGKVRLLTREELPNNWIPSNASPIWLCTQHLVRALATGGEAATAKLAAGFDGVLTDAVKSLAYRLYAIADRKKQTAEALAYNALIASWSDVQTQAVELTGRIRSQGELF